MAIALQRRPGLAHLARGLFAALALMAGAGCEDRSAPATGGPGVAPAANTDAGGAGPAPTSDAAPIKVGHYASMTGKEATFGQSTDRGIRLAIKEINAAGGLNGRQLEVITYDTKGESKEAGNAVTRLITSDKVTAVLGEVASGLSLAGGAVAQQYGVPMISPSSTNPKVTLGRDMVFRVCFIDPFQGFVVAKFARENLKAGKAAVLFDQAQPYSKGLRDEFIKHFQAMGGTIVADEAFSSGDQDFSAQLNTIRAAGPEVIFVPGYYTEAGNIAQQARKLGITVPLMGGDGWDSEQLAAIGQDAIEGCYYSNHYAPDQPSEEVRTFVSKYQSEYGQTPDGLAALGYDAAKVLFEAMKHAPSLEGKALAAAVAQTKDHRGVTGIITIDQNRDATKSAVVVQMKGGKPVWVATVEPPK
ncbi:MAG TPA: ABC transporter substrate-binding protein [Phycisphaerales bacterium]|nr:ABC transporter substrate-binding protein [Phycisphaerales bacterium]